MEDLSNLSGEMRRTCGNWCNIGEGGEKAMNRVKLTAEARERTLERLMTQYGDSVARVCFLFLRDRQLAQDAAQDTFIKAWNALDRLREDGAEKAWLMQIAVNNCKNMLRSRYFRMVDRGISLDELPEAATEDRQGDDTVLKAVMALPDKYREPVILYYYQELTAEETAQALRLPGATVRTRLKRARDLLRTRLEGWYFDNE